MNLPNNVKLNFIFFCESKNQIEIYKKVLVALPENIEITFLYACWNGVITGWLSPILSTLPTSVKIINICEIVPKFLITKLNESKFPKGLLISAYDSYIKSIDIKKAFLIIGNDSSLRGSSLAFVAKNRGLKFCLIQDGFLDFKSKSNQLQKTDQNYNWGVSQPDIAFVWGNNFKDSLINRHFLSSEVIKTYGPLKIFEKKPNLKTSFKKDKKSILWVDQAILDQGKADGAKWQQEFAAIAIKLSEYDTHLRLHPSTSERNKKILEEIAFPYVELTDSASPLNATYLQKFDYVFCYYSTVFLDAISANVPCIIYCTKSLDIELPLINNPLLNYAETLDEASKLINNIESTKNNLKIKALPLSHYVQDPTFDAKHFADEMISKIMDSNFSNKLEEDLDCSYNLAASSLRGKKITIFSGTFGERVGAGIPIKFFIDSIKDIEGEINTVLIQQNILQHLIYEVSQSELLLINSIEVFKNLDSETFKALFDYCDERLIPVIFYIHETEFVINSLLASHQARLDYALKELLPPREVLCVSAKQASWLNKIGITNTKVVYNASFTQFQLSKSETSFKISDEIKVIMIGTQQQRKGVSLFSQVADMMQNSEFNVSFSWYGSETKLGLKEYRSENVKFIPHKSPTEIKNIIKQSSVFFLSSIDDPFPLSAIEAIAAGIPVIAFKDTGIAEIINHYNNGIVFHEYNSISAFNALRWLIKDYKNYSSYVKDARIGFTSENFVNAVLHSLQNAILKSESLKEKSPTLKSNKYVKDIENISLKTKTDFSDISTIVDSEPKKMIDIARKALKEHDYVKAFRVSSTSLKKTPKSTKHFKVLEKAIENLDNKYIQLFTDLEKMHKDSLG